MDKHFCTKQGNETHKLEGTISMFLCCYSVLSSCDHLVFLFKNNMTNSKMVADLKMHHTKCLNVIKNILCDHFDKDLRHDIGDNKFCLPSY